MSRRLVLGVAALVALGVGCSTLPDYMPAQQVSYLDQNWTEAQRRWFYHASQGTRIMPVRWFMALEQPVLASAGNTAFADPAYLGRFGFIPDPVSPENPDGLPV